MNKGNQWQALRYVLDDPTLDRAAFEQRMLEQADLALAVADAVGQISLVQSAAAGTALPASSLRVASQDDFFAPNLVAISTEPYLWHWSSLAALAAVLMLAIGFGAGQLSSLEQSTAESGAATLAPDNLASEGGHSDVSPNASADVQALDSQHFVADHWLATGRETPASDLFDGSDLLLSGDDAREFLPNATESESDEDDDWMLRAAREFYSQGVAS